MGPWLHDGGQSTFSNSARAADTLLELDNLGLGGETESLRLADGLTWGSVPHGGERLPRDRERRGGDPSCLGEGGDLGLGRRLGKGGFQ